MTDLDSGAPDTVALTLSPETVAQGWVSEPELFALVSCCALMAAELAPHREVSLVLCDDETIAELNRDWRGQDKPTDVLSFALDEAAADAPPLPDIGGPAPLGDIIISIPTARRQAAEQGWHLRDELLFLAAHGLCHLVGMDHAEPVEAAEMAQAETRLLAIFGLDRPVGRGF